MEPIRILFKNNAPQIEDEVLDILEKYYNPGRPNTVQYPFFAWLSPKDDIYIIRTYFGTEDDEPKMISTAQFLRAYKKFMDTPIVNQHKNRR